MAARLHFAGSRQSRIIEFQATGSDGLVQLRCNAAAAAALVVLTRHAESYAGANPSLHGNRPATGTDNGLVGD
jgi:hypothetical protein